MDVALDVTAMLTGQTGVAAYARELVAGLPEHGVTMFPFAVGRGTGSVPAGTQRLGLPLRITQRAWRAGLPPRAERIAAGGEVVHSIDLTIPTSGRPMVATIHDVAPITHPELHPPRSRTQLLQRLEQLAGVTVVITVSQSTADALETLGFSPKHVVVVPLGARPAPPPPSDQPGESSPYLLAVGELTPRKDYATLLRAMADRAARHLQLVIVGPAGWRSEETTALAEKLNLGSRVRFAGRVSDLELERLYRDATALCLPSIDEGFGLPLVEAMARGLPVVASDLAVVREVTGDVALTVAVGDVSGFAGALAAIAADRDLRRDLGVAGRARAELFSWDETARKTAAAYELALSCA